MNHPTYTIIAPVHNEEPVLHELHRRIAEVMDATNETWELILVNDGSRDKSAQIIAELNANDPRVRGISLSRNYGFQVAVTCGLDHAKGSAVILIDADLQDPPEVIYEMIKKWREGYDVVYGVRSERAGETWFKKISAKYFYRLIQSITNVKIPVDTGDFRLMDRKVVDAIRRLPERHRFLRGMVSWVGFRQIGVSYKRHARFAGETKFTLRKMIKFATDAITSFSYVPLQLATWFGFLVAGIALLFIIAVIVGRLSGAAEFRGQASTLVAVLFLGGIQLICLGILGEYLGRIYDEVKGRPLYLIQEKWGYDDVTKTN
jgi:dolichol-phosphate mannosyltransferase